MSYNVTACMHACELVLVDLTHGVAALTPRFDGLAGMRFHNTICLVRRYADGSYRSELRFAKVEVDVQNSPSLIVRRIMRT